MRLHDLLGRPEYSKNVFIQDSNQSVSYESAAMQSRQIAAWFAAHGMHLGDRLLIITSRRSEAILAAFAASHLGAIFSILDSGIKPYNLQQILNQCEPTLIILDRATLHLRDKLLLGRSRICVIHDAGTLQTTRQHLNFLEAFNEAEPGEFLQTGSDIAPACLIYTSGSTGSPRGVILSHKHITFATDAIQRRLQYRSGDIIGLFLPLAFDYGLYQFFLAAVSGAAVRIAPEGAAGLELLSFIKKNEISILPGVPGLFATLLRHIERSGADIPHLQCLTNTGERLPDDYIEKLSTYLPHASLFLMYGLTECKRVSILLPDERLKRPNSVGRALDGTTIEIIDESGKTLPANQTGELVVKGPHVAQGYWNAPQETALRFRPYGEKRELALHTGDFCRIDSDGYLYFIDRIDTMVKHRGYRMSPLEIENAACDIPGIRECGVVLNFETGHLWLFACSSDRLSPPNEIISCLQDRLEDYKIPDCVHFMSELPKTANGKIDRKALIVLSSALENQ